MIYREILKIPWTKKITNVKVLKILFTARYISLNEIWRVSLCCQSHNENLKRLHLFILVELKNWKKWSLSFDLWNLRWKYMYESKTHLYLIPSWMVYDTCFWKFLRFKFRIFFDNYTSNFRYNTFQRAFRFRIWITVGNIDINR